METKIPQLEDGFTRIANQIFDNLCKINLSSYQTRVLHFIFRKTYGYNKKEDWISVSQVVEATGLHKSHVSRTKKELLLRKLVTSNGNKIAFQKDSRLWCELPVQVTIKKVTSTGQKVTNSGQKLPVQADTKDNIQKTITKERGARPFYKTKEYLVKLSQDIEYCKQEIREYFLNPDHVKQSLNINATDLQRASLEALNWCEANNKIKSNYRAFIHNWLIREHNYTFKS